ncbi:response regulator [Microvirga yunnanensis]|uniref:response regulator n=1 Tax=Microvirga yunnanensis TaxID=2953740 RepID=UPI0021C62AD3|nr:response regulator [Microvirga sp. HBU65207]
MLTSINAAYAAHQKAIAMPDAIPNASPIQILFAEDSEHLREYMSQQLRACGYAVIGVPSGDDALTVLLGGAASDLLLTDINMPGSLNGWALARQCRDLRPGLLVIYASSERAVREEQVPNSCFLPKPYQFPALLALVQQVVTDQWSTRPSAAAEVAEVRQVPVAPSSG